MQTKDTSGMVSTCLSLTSIIYYLLCFLKHVSSQLPCCDPAMTDCKLSFLPFAWNHQSVIEIKWSL